MTGLFAALLTTLGASLAGALLYRRHHLRGARLWHQRCAQLQRQLDDALALLQALPVAVIGTDRQGAVRYLNPCAETMTGARMPAAAGKPLRELLTMLRDGVQVDLRQQILDCVGSAPPPTPAQPVAGQPSQASPPATAYAAPAVAGIDTSALSQPLPQALLHPLPQPLPQPLDRLPASQLVSQLLSPPVSPLVNPPLEPTQLRLADGRRIDVEHRCAPLLAPASAAGPTAHGDGAVLVLHDVSARRDAAARLEFIAHHDALTGLPNRLQFQLRLEHGIAYAKRHRGLLAVLFVDIDRFKVINDTLGHEMGDQVLVQFAERLQGCVREVDTVARQGGDEFIVLLTEMRLPQDAERVAGQILQAIGAPFVIGDNSLAVAASLGMAIYPDDDDDLDALIEKADLAMYAAKQRGAGAWLRYAPSMQAKAYSRMILETALRHALAQQEFVLTYQPKLDLKAQRISGVKALIRWKHPELGLVMPLDFMPILEDSALILPVGAWVLATAVAQAKRWIDLGQPLTISVNLSARQFYQKDIVQSFTAILAEAGLPGHFIELEITESVLIDKNQNCEAILRQFKQLGMGISISDFGTGYASLNYLKRFPVDVVKIDKSFVDDLRRHGGGGHADDGAMVRAIIVMAHTLKMKVIAGGVETREQLAQLAAMDCDEAFGFCLSRAVTPAEIEALIRSRQAASLLATAV